ncbi:RNA 2',3'-cyclic phosphodiesterase [Rhodomicrobium vannielii ATCC 17100]|uniref:RNA 2',3'-cyclic phosphodiesterase n=1 Tax=Rhodomicrobium vannielii TaxID=1069 RepID=UPI001919CA60|nr:RNA 2',3'-cyclic phosphodiesterase [Rhodomicrobium vannielii]MBJ7533189.1 RNA 2',3'-cyclic phosphodiesterase [Rhodomicrobium vannielii ATCC 17100]
MPRLFTGLELPHDVVGHLSGLRAGLSGASWLDAENYHITLRFVGDITDAQANDFADALADIRFESFDIAVSGLGSFGGNKPRSLWAGVKASPALETLQRAHERAARAAGLPPEPRNFTPHVTLARLRNVSPFAAADYLARHGGFACEPFTVSRFVLFSSRPNQGGGPYVVEEAYSAWDAHFAEDEELFAHPHGHVFPSTQSR